MKKRVLFVDDDQEVLSGLRRNLRVKGKVWECHFVESGYDALKKVEEQPYDLVVTDGKMPGMTGSELLRKLGERDDTKDIPSIMLTGFYEDELRRKALESGVIEFLNKPIVPEEFILRLENVLRLKSVSDELKIKNRELEETRLQVIRRLGKAAEYRDNETGKHVVRVAHISRIIARGMNLPEEKIDMLFTVAPMHDIGKIGIPDSILKKPGVLDAFEFEVMSTHSSLGKDMLAPLSGEEMEVYRTHTIMGEDILSEEETPLLKMASEIAATHHERWDGHGYPKGLAKEAIPIEARIVSVADIFDALSSVRPYKPALPFEECRDIVLGMSGKNLDPKVVESFKQNYDEIVSVAERFRD